MPGAFSKLLRKLWRKPAQISSPSVKNYANMEPRDKELLKNMGASYGELAELMQKATHVNTQRISLYREIDRALLHWMVGAAMECYADVATTYSSMQGATVWPSGDEKYCNIITKFLDAIGIEEKIFDWAYTTGAYGDLFVKVVAQPGLGVIAVEDDAHPMGYSRVDLRGRLIGFYDTPLGSVPKDDATLIPPWDLVHFRLLGAKVKRPIYGDATYSEYRTVYMMSNENKQFSSLYGSSVLLNALATYKRLRLAEDSLLLARMSKGVLRYIYKVKVDATNFEAVSAILDEYKTALKRTRGINLDPNNPNFEERAEELGVNEDVIIPVWGSANDLQVEKLGGETDIKWIADIEELRNQLSTSLRVPLQVMGGAFMGEMPGGLNTSALERVDIRFARTVRRLQRAVIQGITRLCQIHLSYLNMDPNVSHFQINMPETSSAEEDELKEALEKGTNVVDQLLNIFDRIDPDGEYDKWELFSYLNDKILRLSDFDASLIRKQMKEGKSVGAVLTEALKLRSKKKKSFLGERGADYRAHTYIHKDRALWEKSYKDAKVILKEKK